MKTPPRVVVFVASFNRRDQLRQSIGSILEQTYANFELLLVDDASSDGSAELCRSYARQDPRRIHAICNRRNRGLRWNLNLALDRVRADELLAVHAHDDVALPDRLQRSVSALLQKPSATMVFSDATIIDEHGERQPRRFSHLWGPHCAQEDVLQRLLTRGNYICATTVTARGSALRSAHARLPREVQLCVDTYLWYVLAAAGEVLYLDEPVGLYRISPGQMTDRARETQREDFLIPALAHRRHAVVRRRLSAADVRASQIARGWMYLDARRAAGDWREVLWYGLRLLRIAPSAGAARRVARSIGQALVNHKRNRTQRAA